MQEFKKLFTKIKIGKMELKNRICFGEQAILHRPPKIFMWNEPEAEPVW